MPVAAMEWGAALESAAVADPNHVLLYTSRFEKLAANGLLCKPIPVFARKSWANETDPWLRSKESIE